MTLHDPSAIAAPTSAPTLADACGVRRRGLLLVLSSPSGAGKSTICRALLQREPEVALSVSVTTRPPRPGEVHGRDYFFVDKPEFERMVRAGDLLEHAQVFGNFYGTPRAPVESALAAGRDTLFDIDWQGHRKLVVTSAADVVSIFVLPPSVTELERRLRDRGQDSDEVIARRMAKATDEISHWNEYRYVIVNRDIDRSIEAVRTIIEAERLRGTRQTGLAALVADMRGVGWIGASCT